MDDESISIPLSEFEKLSNCYMLEGKQPIIRDLQQLLHNKEEDLKRYKEKYEQSEQLLGKTRHQLDNCIKNAESSISLSSSTAQYIQLKRSEDTPSKCSSRGIKLVARSVSGPGDDDDTTSLSLSKDNSNRILSLPIGNTAPGASTSLLKKLVQENLKLKSQIEKRGVTKNKVSNNTETAISELKLELAKKNQKIVDLTAKYQAPSSCNDDQQKLSALLSQNAELVKQNDTQRLNLEMNKIVIESMKQEQEKLRKERDNMAILLQQYQEYSKQHTYSAISEAEVRQLQQRLEEQRDARIHLAQQLEITQADLDKEKNEKQKLQQEHIKLKQNYSTVYKQMEIAATANHPFSVAAALKPATFHMHHTLSESSFHEQSSQNPALPPRRSASEMRKPPAPLPHTGSYTLPTQMRTYRTPPAPQPAERKTYKCPRCETMFSALQDYRNHIKSCLST